MISCRVDENALDAIARPGLDRTPSLPTYQEAVPDHPMSEFVPLDRPEVARLPSLPNYQQAIELKREEEMLELEEQVETFLIFQTFYKIFFPPSRRRRPRRHPNRRGTTTSTQV